MFIACATQYNLVYLCNEKIMIVKLNMENKQDISWFGWPLKFGCIELGTNRNKATSLQFQFDIKITVISTTYKHKNDITIQYQWDYNLHLLASATNPL